MLRRTNIRLAIVLWGALIACSFYVSKGSSYALFLILWLQYPLSMNQILSYKLQRKASQRLVLGYQVVFIVWFIWGLYYFSQQTNAVAGAFSVPSYSMYSLPVWIALLVASLLFERKVKI